MKQKKRQELLTPDQRRAQELIAFDNLPLFGIRYSRGHLYRMIKAKKFPRPVRLGDGRVAFAREVIIKHIKKIKATVA